MRKLAGLMAVLICFVTANVFAITADELIAKNIEARGGLEKIKSIQSIRQTGKARFGSTEVGYSHTAKRPAMVRDEYSLQGLTSVVAYDGRDGWTISPFQGRVDPERMAGDDLKLVQLEADMDGPLVDYKAKGHKAEYLGTEDVDGTDAHKLKITLKNGDVRYVYLDPDYFLEIRVTDQTTVRGVIQEVEMDLGNYEKVEGIFLPFSIEAGEKGQPKNQKITIEKTEVNLTLDDNLFHFPTKK